MNLSKLEKVGPLAAARKSALINQGEMAQKMGVSIGKIGRIEKNPDSVSHDVLMTYWQNVDADGKRILEEYYSLF